MSRRILREEQRAAKRQAELAAAEQAAPRKGGAAIFDAGSFMEQIGNPDWERLLMAAAVAASIPESVRTAAHSADWAPEVLFYTLLDNHPEVQEKQMLIIAQRMGSDSDTRVRGLVGAASRLRPEQRLPLMEVALPSLKRHPPEVLQKILGTVNELIHADGRVDVFEYLLARVVTQYLWESVNPHAVKNAGRHSLSGLQSDAAMVIAILSRHGHESEAATLKAYERGMAGLGQPGVPGMPATGDWISQLDDALARLDKLKLADKEVLVKSMIETVTADGHLVASELELLRAVCAIIHVPVPILPAGSAT